jgi:hypothetical protein
MNAPVAQLVEQLPLKQTVVGPIPTGCTNEKTANAVFSFVLIQEDSPITSAGDFRFRASGQALNNENPFSSSRMPSSWHASRAQNKSIASIACNTFILCPGEDSNLHGSPRQLLRLVRLPISPPGHDIYFCAQGGNRTRMALRPRDFKSLASTNFATRAIEA